MAEGPLTVAGCQLLTNGLLPGGEVFCGASQRWSRAAQACAGLLGSAPRAENATAESSQSEAQTAPAVVLLLSVDQVVQAGEATVAV